MNILDVWFDSGSSHEAVLSVRPELTWPADIYLEGSDQHRGWFQSSLLVGLGTRGRAPFRQVLTHGFVVAEDGRKMSKSLGNSIEPQDIIKQSGADILRLWVAMSDYTQEIRLSKEILARVVEAYRKIRNTLRYLRRRTSTTSIRRPTGCRARQLEEVDRYILARYADAGQPDPARPTRSTTTRTIFQALNAFATVDLSAFYADVSKDRLYTFAARSPERRSAQTAMYLMADGLTRLMAPILSVHGRRAVAVPARAPREESVHIARVPGRRRARRAAPTRSCSSAGRSWSRCASRCSPRSSRCARTSRSAARCRRRSCCRPRRPSSRCSSATPGELPMLFIVSEVELRPAPTGRRRRTRTRSRASPSSGRAA